MAFDSRKKRSKIMAKQLTSIEALVKKVASDKTIDMSIEITGGKVTRLNKPKKGSKKGDTVYFSIAGDREGKVNNSLVFNSLDMKVNIDTLNNDQLAILSNCVKDHLLEHSEMKTDIYTQYVEAVKKSID